MKTFLLALSLLTFGCLVNPGASAQDDRMRLRIDDTLVDEHFEQHVGGVARAPQAFQCLGSLHGEHVSPHFEAVVIELADAETVEEVRFYLEHFMTDQARAGIEKLEALTSDVRILDPLRAAVESAGQPPAEPEPEIAEINADDPA